ncbi:hypothetical protein HPB52_011448 [Rhipicephalus sanguineus]|uniref:Uncharacterized protein n=1 Tax=Rhipicephalus sanguineus TaxID=34632 RepID=A0A9D4PDC7_RHISA|nr:hypothetical protein HPB52_011448 [Rhipicephalus sanguineus]
MTARKAQLKMFSSFVLAPFSNGTPRDCQVAPAPAAEAFTSAACVNFVLPSARDVEKPGTLLRSTNPGASVAHVEVPKPIVGRSVTRTPIAQTLRTAMAVTALSTQSQPTKKVHVDARI